MQGAVSITISIPIAATGKARPRERGRLPTRYRSWKKTASALISKALHIEGYTPQFGPTVPVGVRVVSYAKRPTARPAALRHACTPKQWREGFRALRLATPDADNLEGAVWDAINDTGLVWADDAQAVSLGCWEWYAPPGEAPRIEITLAGLSVEQCPSTFLWTGTDLTHKVVAEEGRTP